MFAFNKVVATSRLSVRLPSGRTLTVSITRRSRRRTIGIYVTHGAAEMRLPLRCTLKQARVFLVKKAKWLEGVLTHVQPQPQPLQSGSKLPFMDEVLELDLRLADRQDVRRVSDRLVVMLPRGYYESLTVVAQREAVWQALGGWYASEAQVYLPIRVAALAKRVGVQPQGVKVGKSRSNWGSCSHKGSLRFSWRVLLTPIVIVDSVVIHELCHMLEHNHSAAFWALVAKHDPYIARAKKWFRDVGSRLPL